MPTIPAIILNNIGFLLWAYILLLIYFGRLRNNTTLSVLFIVSLIPFLHGLSALSAGISLDSDNKITASLFTPIIYLTLYSFMRWVYKITYGFEPDFVPHSGYSYRDNRKLNLFDFLVVFIPTALSIGIPLYIR